MTDCRIEQALREQTLRQFRVEHPATGGEKKIAAEDVKVLDLLVVGNCVLRKSEQNAALKQDYSSAFELD
jgi:hypothetical protein